MPFSALTEEIEMNPKAPKFKVGNRVRIMKHKNIFSKGYTENWSKEIILGCIELKIQIEKK